MEKPHTLTVTLLIVALLAMATPAAADIDPDFLTVAMWIDCTNHDKATGAHEPILTDWSGSYDPFNPDDRIEVLYVVTYTNGTTRVIEPYGMTTHGYHDSWIHPDFPVWGESFTVDLWLDGELYSSVSATCDPPVAVTPPVIIDPAPTRAPGAPVVQFVRTFGPIAD